MGVPIGATALLKVASPRNPAGFWEVQRLSAFNETLLRELGGSWSAPPEFSTDFGSDPDLAATQHRAAELLAQVHQTVQWVWKDPRNCVTLPLWRHVIDAPIVVVLVHRHPLEVCRSLDTRDGLEKGLSLALWERYMRSALVVAAGLPTLVIGYADLVEGGAVDSLQRFLHHNQIVTHRDAIARARELLDPSLRHAIYRDDALDHDGEASDGQRALAGALGALSGPYERFRPPALPPETPANRLLFAQRRHVEESERRLDAARRDLERATARVALLEDRLREVRAKNERHRKERDAARRRSDQLRAKLDARRQQRQQRDG
jgi:hypothetical protein